MADEILIVFKADTGDLDKVVGKIEQLTKLQADLKAEVSSTYAGKQLDEAVNKLNKQAETIDKLNTKYSDATNEVKKLEEELNTLSSSGAANVKRFNELQKAMDEAKSSAGELGKAVKEAAAKPEVFESLIGTVKALKTAFSSTSTLLKSMGADTTTFENATKSLTGAIEELEAAQSLMNAVVGKGSIATKALSTAQAIYTTVITTCTSATKLFRAALASVGIGLLVVAIGVLVENWDKLKKAISGNSEGFQKFKEILKGMSPTLAAIVNGIQYVVQHFDELKEVMAGVAAGTALVFSKIGDSMGAVLTLQFSKIKEIWKNALKEIEEQYNNGKKNSHNQTALENERDAAAFEVKLAETTGKGIYQAKKKYMELELKDMKGKNEDTRLLEAELTKLIEDEQARRTAAWKAATEKQKKIDKEKLDAEIALSQSNISNEIAAIEEKLLWVKKGSDEEVQLFKKLIDTKIKLAKGDPSLSKEKKSLEIAKLKKEGEDYLTQLAENKAKALQAELIANKKAMTEINSNRELQLKLQKDFNLTQEQVDEDFAKSSYKSFADYEKQKRNELTKTDEAKKKSAEARIKLEQEVYNQIKTLASSLSNLTSSIFSAEATNLENAKNKELETVGDNAAAKEQIEKKFAIKKAELARKQAIADKTFALFNIVLNTAEAISKAGSNPALIALAVANGALQTAAVSAQPLPEIPQYEKGGPITNKLLHGRSHRQGGILINAQGGEYIWDIPTVKKHGDIIRAAHENRLEDLMMHKYIVPAMQRTLPAAKTDTAALYDDFMLRATIKQSSEKADKNAKYIADRVSQAVASSMFNQNRYN